jgi:hypothetical protein
MGFAPRSKLYQQFVLNVCVKLTPPAPLKVKAQHYIHSFYIMFGSIIYLILLKNQLIIHQNDRENECNSFLIVIPSLYVQTLRNRAVITFGNSLSGRRGATITTRACQDVSLRRQASRPLVGLTGPFPPTIWGSIMLPGPWAHQCCTTAPLPPTHMSCTRLCSMVLHFIFYKKYIMWPPLRSAARGYIMFFRRHPPGTLWNLNASNSHISLYCSHFHWNIIPLSATVTLWQPVIMCFNTISTERVKLKCDILG